MRFKTIAGLLMFVATLAPAAHAQAPAGSNFQSLDAPGRACSDMTARGTWGTVIEGAVVGSSSVFRGLDLAYLDGRGHITQVDHFVDDGVAPTQDWTPGTGTYSVNPDCTGSAVINSGSTPYPIAFHFILVENGKKMLQVVDANAVIAIAYRVN
jgi:hypothetical protein